jgi:3'-5' exonuclease
MPSSNELRRKAKNLLFIDIETASCVEEVAQLSERMQEMWHKKAQQLKNQQEVSEADLFVQRAAIYAEFGRVICIGVGVLHWDNADQMSLRVKTLADHDERALLLDFKQLIEKYPEDQLVLCAHNGKEFDFPYLCRRMLISGLELPRALQFSGKKPWEILHQDTLEMWKFGDYKNYTPLDLLAALFDIPSSKSDISGQDVTRVFYQEKDLARIARYCREDVVVLAQLYLRLLGYPLIAEPNIVRVS